MRLAKAFASTQRAQDLDRFRTLRYADDKIAGADLKAGTTR